MTDIEKKREKIQDGMTDYIRLVGNKPKVYTPEMCSEDLMEFLDSEDVAIRVKLEGNIDDLDFSAVKPLIKEA